MGASALMALGVKTMAANYAALKATGHNIANANVEGYSRQKVEFATTQGQFTGAGFFGKGVDVATVSRAHNAFLTREAAMARSVARADSTKLNMLEQLEAVFATGERGLGHVTGQFLNSMVDLASQPADSATREVVLARAQDLATSFASAGRTMDTLQRSVSSDITTQVTTVNDLATSLARLNGAIVAVNGLGQPPNDLLDERDRLLARLNELVSVTTVAADDGSTAVFIGGGQNLVLGAQTTALEVLQDPLDPARTTIGYRAGGASRTIDLSTLGGGSLVGLMRFQNEDLVDARNLLGRLFASVAGAVNKQQLLGVNLYQPLGGVASEPMFAMGEPRTVARGTNLKDALDEWSASASLTIVDPGALKASDYELVVDPGGTPNVFVLTRLSDGLQRVINNGDVVDGVRIDVAGTPGATDSFLLQPVSRAANGARLLLDDARDIAAASPLVATAIPGPNGTMSIDSLRMLAAPTYPGHTVRMAFTSDNGDYSWDLVDGGGAVVSSGTGQWAAGSPIPTPPVDMNGFSLLLQSVPRLGDQIVVEPAGANNFTQNNGNALALAALRDGLIVDGLTASDSYAAAMTDVGVRVQGARSIATITTAQADMAERARSNESGVNLDEEAARLVQFQQSYQAAAKVLQVAQQIFDILLQTADR
jgi:flagellar hook-associated protein 1